MKQATRTDQHRPSAIIPHDYTERAFYYTGAFGGFGVTCGREVDGNGYPVGEPRHDGSGNCCVTEYTRTHAMAAQGGLGSCSICGALFSEGSIWLHIPSGESIHVGHNCADKYEFVRSLDASEFRRWRKAERARRSDAAKDMVRAKASAAFLAQHDGLADDLALDHSILHDLSRKLRLYGSLSEAQVALARKLAGEARNPKPETAKVEAPEGRITVTGKVVSIKAHESMYGTTIKMVVVVATPAGEWACWGTVPAAIDPQRGDTVEFTGTLTRGNDAHFAFFKRPTGASIVQSAVAAV